MSYKFNIIAHNADQGWKIIFFYLTGVAKEIIYYII